jgi:hypothetical protein
VTDKNPLILDFRNGRVLDGADLDEYYVSSIDEEPANWDDIDLEAAFSLPPVRLPEEAELAAQARRSALLADLRALADEVRTTTVQTTAVNPVLLRLAEEAELVESGYEDLAPGEDAGWLDDLADDGDALDAWEYTFAEVLDTTLEAADESDPVVADELDLEGHGPALVTRLFLSRRDGVRITEPAGALKDAATAGLEAEEAGSQWQEWVDAHGDPLRLLLGQLVRLGAVSVTDDAARLEPLGVQAVRSKLERDHLFVPVLPARDKMTPDDLVLVWMHGSDDDLETELASWTVPAACVGSVVGPVSSGATLVTTVHVVGIDPVPPNIAPRSRPLDPDLLAGPGNSQTFPWGVPTVVPRDHRIHRDG